MSEPKPDVERILQHRAELYIEMSKTPAFTEFVAEMERKEARLKDEIYSQVWGADPVNQREVDIRRGFIEGMRYLQTVIAAAERKLNRLDADASAESEPENDERPGDW